MNTEKKPLFKKIPSISCDPYYSISRVPTSLPGGLETTKLVADYGFTSEDLGLIWGSKLTTVAGADPQDRDACVSGNQVDGDDNLFVQITLPTYPDETPREINWISSPLPCSDASDTGGIALQGPVPTANRRRGSFSMPTFVPRAGGSRKDSDSSTSKSLQLGIYRGIDPDTGKHLVELVAVGCDGGLVYAGETVTAAGWDYA